jgi:amino acid adenylation domain-containing protein
VEFGAEDTAQSVPARFEQQVARHGDRPAISSATCELSYRQLDRLANRIARAILACLGDGNEPVAVLFEHDAVGIAAILGVLKAGKCYVPLDPASPAIRTAHILTDSGARLLVTGARCRHLAVEFAGDRLGLLDIDALGPDAPAERPALDLSPRLLASMYYTSGSTGRPKGVPETHGNRLVNARRMTNALRICPDDRLVMLYATGFSGSVNALFGALLNGARLCPFDLREGGPAELARWLRQQAITIYHSTPPVFRSFVDSLAGADAFPSLRVVLLASDSVYAADVERYRRRFSDSCLLLNAWGATEAPFFRPYFVDKTADLPGDAVPAIGPSSEETEIRLLDDGGVGVAPGETGEIVVVSRYLSPGYWRQDDLTRARFRPVGPDSDERAYFTGDLGRALPDGSIVHLGRRDFQVKVRGYRVEPAEIEAELRKLEGIEDAVVMGRADGIDGHQLVAYLVPAGVAPTVTALRRALRRTLPEYLVPSRFVMLPALPLTPNGKIDRRALPDPAPTRPELETPFREPRPHDAFERQLTLVWQDVLSVKPIGVEDDFFELGGGSLLAVQLLAEIGKRMGKQIPLAVLFQGRTIAHLADYLRRQGEATPEAWPIETLPERAGVDRIGHPIGRYLPSRYHRYVKRTYRRLHGMYVRHGGRVARRYFGYTPKQLEEQLRRMGIGAGDTVMMHSAFRMVSGFTGTPDQVMTSVLKVIGDAGNLVMVSMPYRGSTAEYLRAGIPFDVQHTMSQMGVITEMFRQHPGVLRSLNPAHPILAWGPAARWLVSDHEHTMYSCGKGSPFEKLVPLQPKALFYDVTLNTMTFSHYLEDRFQDTLPVRLYEETPVESVVIDGRGNTRTANTYVFSRASRQYRGNWNLPSTLIQKRAMTMETIGNTRLIVLQLQHVVHHAEETVKSGQQLWMT